MWLGAGLMAVVLRAAGRPPTLAVTRTAIPGAIAYGISVWLLFGAFQTTSLASAAIIVALQPGFILGLVYRLFGEPVQHADLALTAAATIGVVVVVLGGRASGVSDLRGDALAFGAMLAGAAYLTLVKRARLRGVPAGEYQFGLLFVAATITVPVFVVFDGTLNAPIGGDWFRLAGLVGGATSGHLGLNWAHRHIPLKTTSLLTLGVPVISTALGWAVLGERLSGVQIFGATLALAALVAVIIRDVRPPRTRGGSAMTTGAGDQEISEI